jgi:hypothetical protein
LQKLREPSDQAGESEQTHPQIVWFGLDGPVLIVHTKQRQGRPGPIPNDPTIQRSNDPTIQGESFERVG